MTNLVRREPVPFVPFFAGQLDRLFRDPVSIFDNGLTSATQGPAVTIYETKDEYVFQAELPGWTREQVSINFENQTLTLSGNRDLQNGDGRQYHRVEGFYGQFSRSFTVPGVVDFNRVEAVMKDGVLTVCLPKREEAKPRQIEVKTVQ
jgi:HSP20 family protein